MSKHLLKAYAALLFAVSTTVTSCVKPRAYTVYTAVAMPSAQTALLAGEHRTIVGDDLYVQYFLWNCAVHTRPTGTRMDCHDVVVEYEQPYDDEDEEGDEDDLVTDSED